MTLAQGTPGSTTLAHGSTTLAHSSTTALEQCTTGTMATHNHSPPQLRMCFASFVAMWFGPLGDDPLQRPLEPSGHAHVSLAETSEPTAPALNPVEFFPLEPPFLAIASRHPELPCPPLHPLVAPHNASTTRTAVQLSCGV